MGTELRLVECTYAAHGAAILDILNEAIVSSTALYDYAPRTMDNMRAWFDAKEAGRSDVGPYPVIGIEGPGGTLMGFASYGLFRNWPAYKYSVEHSVYVHGEQRGQGIGRLLMMALIERARAQAYHTLVGVIDTSNAASIAFHERLGFERGGGLRQVAYKFGRWLDVAFYQRVLDTPSEAREG